MPLLSSSNNLADSLAISLEKATYCQNENFSFDIIRPASLNDTDSLELYYLKDNDPNDSVYLGKTSSSTFEITISKVGIFTIFAKNANQTLAAYSEPFTINESSFLLSVDNPSHCNGLFSTIANNFHTINSTIVWKLDGEIIDNASNTTLEAYKSGNYSSEFEYQGCTMKSNEIKITNNTIPAVSLKALLDLPEYCEGSKVPLVGGDVTLFPYSGFDISRNDTTLITDLQSNILFNAEKSGTYRLISKQGECQAISEPVEISFKSAISSPMLFAFSKTPPYNTAQQELSFSKCTEQSVNLYAYVFQDDLNADVLKEQYEVSAAWEKDGKIIAENKLLAFETKEAGTYRQLFTQGNCSVYSSPVTIINDDKPIVEMDYRSSYPSIKMGNQIDICTLDNVNLGLPESPSFYGDVQPYLYKDTTLIASYDQPFLNYIKISEEGTYHIEMKSNRFANCRVYTNALTFTKKSVASSNVTSSYCEDSDSIEALTSGVFPNRTWYKNDTLLSGESGARLTLKSPGQYSLKVNPEGCEYTYNFDVKNTYHWKWNSSLSEEPLADNSVLTLCPSSSIILYHKAKQWDANDVNISINRNGLFDSNFEGSAKINKPGIYTVSGQIVNCDISSETVTVNFKEPNYSFTPAKSTVELCSTGFDSASFYLSGDISNLRWYENNELLSENGNNLNVKRAGSYHATFQHGKCIYETPTKNIIISNAPTASISGDTVLNFNESATLKFNFTSNPPYSVKLTNGESFVTDSNPYFYSTAPLTSSTSYAIGSVENDCGIGTGSGQANIEILILSSEPSGALNLQVYPNPNTQFINVAYQLKKPGTANLILTDLNGKTISNNSWEFISQLNEKMDVSNLSSGTYLVLLNADGQVYQRKIVKY